MAISLASGKVLWRHDYNSPNGGPDGVNVANGVVYAATNHAAVALSAATGSQLWSRTLIGNDHEGIDMTPGYNHGTVYVSTVPVNPASVWPTPARWAASAAIPGGPAGPARTCTPTRW
jgi:outer membrane protein assembly factor BamB